MNQTILKPRPIFDFYDGLISVLNMGQSGFLLFIRIYIGYQCVISGFAHLGHFDQTAKYFGELHIPFPRLNVAMSAMTELIGGLLLGLGLLSRVTAFFLAGNFIVAMVTVQLSNFNFSFLELMKKIWNDQSPILGDTAFPFLVTAIIILLFGPGKLSLDWLIRLVCGSEPNRRLGSNVIY